MRGKTEESSEGATLDELLRMSTGGGPLARAHPSDLPNLGVGWNVGEAAARRSLRGRLYWFLRRCIDWIEPPKY